MRRLAPLSLLIVPAGCLMPPAPAGAGSVVVRSAPAGALVTFGDGTTCQTPCQVAVPGPLTMTVAKAGYRAVRTRIDGASPAALSLDLVPVGRTAPVEASELPPL